jgi:hypothetical protein
MVSIAVILLLLPLLVSMTRAFGPKAFVPLHQNAVSSASSLLPPDPLQPAKSVVSPTTNMMMRRRRHRRRNMNGTPGHPLLRMAGYGNNDYYYNNNNNNSNNYGPFQNGYRGFNNDFNGMMNEGYNGEYYGGGPSHSMQHNSNVNMRYNQYEFDRQNYYNDWSGNRGNRGAPLMNNRRLDYYYDNNNNNGGASFYNNEGKRVRRYDPYMDRSLYNEDALYMQQQAAQAQRGYETSFNRGYNTGGYGSSSSSNNNGIGLRRYDPYYDQGAGYYNQDALYDRTGKGLLSGQQRFALPPSAGGYGGYNLDPYYSPDRFGWGETGGRPNRGRYNGGYDDYMDHDETMMMMMMNDRRNGNGGGYSQRPRRPSSSVLGSNVGRGRGRRGDYGGYDQDYDMYEEDRRRQRRSVRARADGRDDYYPDDEDMYDRSPRSTSSSTGGSTNGGRRVARRDPFTRNIEDDAMENMRSGRGRRGEPTTSRREEREYAMTGADARGRRDGRGSNGVNGSYGRGSTVNGSYYPPPRGEANGGMSIDDLKDML